MRFNLLPDRAARLLNEFFYFIRVTLHKIDQICKIVIDASTKNDIPAKGAIKIKFLP